MAFGLFGYFFLVRVCGLFIIYILLSVIYLIVMLGLEFFLRVIVGGGEIFEREDFGGVGVVRVGRGVFFFWGFVWLGSVGFVVGVE